MSFHSLFLLSLLAIVNSQTPTTSLVPLSQRTFAYGNLPYQVSGSNAGPRGPQYGFNLCNSTTQNQNSSCQTSVLNDITDFCLWSSPKPNDTIGNSEAYEVAWCTKPNYGTRVIPPGALQGVQWLYAKNYVQVAGYIDQTMINLAALDSGGELDPHGDDEQGNPIGGVVYSNGFTKSSGTFQQQLTSGTNTTGVGETQVIEWVNFIGNGLFCFKACNPSYPQATSLCNHIYDEIGCQYNAVANYGTINNTFQVCDSDDMTPPGVYTGANGQVTTWVQPFTGTVSVPYPTPTLASSNCVTYTSSLLYQAAATYFPSSATPSATSTGGPGASGSGTHSGSSGSAANPRVTGSGAIGNNVAIGAPIALFFGVVFGVIITVFG